MAALDDAGGAGMPTAGGTGILGDNMTITNGGSITGGEGGLPAAIRQALTAQTAVRLYPVAI